MGASAKACFTLCFERAVSTGIERNEDELQPLGNPNSTSHTTEQQALRCVEKSNNPSCSRAPTHPPGTRTIFSFRRRLVASVPCSAGSPGPAPFGGGPGLTGLHLAPSYLTSGKELTSPPSLPRGDAFSSPSLHFFLFFFLSFVPQQGTG